MNLVRLCAVAAVFIPVAACGSQSSSSEPTSTVAESAATPSEPAATAPATGPAETAHIGDPAPTFSLVDVDGKQVSLASYRGKVVVLEWFNPSCPFIQYAHTKGPLVTMAKASADDVAWLAINSNAPGKEGSGAEANRAAKAKFGFAYPLLLDETGTVGLAYGAKSTPHMFVINKDGILVYKGALDNKPVGKLRGDTYINYVTEALAAVSAGEPVKTAETTSYGCSVKYGS
ncbi:MAG TPA: thioredoxin family protein [Kofleriaceae bacterium]|nr:thioredoxin family protein [Kofleriaceae bacterium]